MKTRTGIQPDEYPNLTVGKATKLATARNMQVDLASGNSQAFDGSADATEIGVKGILPEANGGTGATSLDNITVGRANADGNGNNIAQTYLNTVLTTMDLNAVSNSRRGIVFRISESAANQPTTGGGALFQYYGGDDYYTQIFIANDLESSTWRRAYRSTDQWTSWVKLLSGARPTWVTGTTGSLTLPGAGWYIMVSDYSMTGVFYWDGSNDCYVSAGLLKSSGTVPVGLGISESGVVSRRGGSAASYKVVSYYKLA